MALVSRSARTERDSGAYCALWRTVHVFGASRFNSHGDAYQTSQAVIFGGAFLVESKSIMEMSGADISHHSAMQGGTVAILSGSRVNLVSSIIQSSTASIQDPEFYTYLTPILHLSYTYLTPI